MTQEGENTFYKRLSSEVDAYTSRSIEISEGVKFSQYATIKRLMKFKNRDLAGSKIGEDLRYIFYFDIISPRCDSEVKNLRFDTKNILVFSRNPSKDFPAVFISNAQLKDWMCENGEDDKLKAVVEEFTGNGNVGFKRIKGGYEVVDPLNTYITNQKAETVDNTDVIERHEMTASQLTEMTEWNNIENTIADLGNKTFTATTNTTPITTTSPRYEIFEFTGEISEAEFNELKDIEGGDKNNYFLAKIIVAGLNKSGTGTKYTLFAEKLKGKLSDYYLYAHRGKYEGRFWRVGMYELLFDHQIRANEIGNDIAKGLEWASKKVFHSTDQTVLKNIRADIDNGDVIISKDLTAIDIRMSALDQLLADWNRLMTDADRLSNSFEVSRGENPPSGTPFSSVALMDTNAGKMYVTLRQKIALPFRRVFREWVLPELVKHLKGQDIFRLVGDTEILDQFRDLAVNAWYIQNLVKIGPHTKEQADAIRQEKLDEMRNIDPVIENSQEIWKGVLPRLFVTITGENSDLADNVTDMINLIQYEQDTERAAWLLDTIYKIRGIPVPPKKEEMQPENQKAQMMNEDMQKNPQTKQQRMVKSKQSKPARPVLE